jgi:hypothetical protein
MNTERYSEGNGVSARILRNGNGNVLIIGKIQAFAGSPQKIRFIAPKGIHRGMSFAGSGLPYHNADQAFDGTENTGVINSPDGSFSIEFDKFPSAYYTGLGSTYVPPVLILETIKANSSDPEDPEVFKTHIFLSPEGVPYRWIAGAPSGPRYPPAEGQIGRAMYYGGREELPLFQNQEMLLRNKGYPADETAFGLPGRMDMNPWENTPSPA